MDHTPLFAQPPLPFPAAQRYEDTVLEWARDLDAGILRARDLAYGPDPQQCYDVFAAAGMRGAPVLVFWHGGGWTNGYKEYVHFMAEAVVRRGLVFVAPTYRLAPRHRLPAAFDDAALLLGELRRTVGRWGGDGRNLYLSGHSAGGGTAAMAALRKRALERAGVPPGDIRGCLPISGVMDLHHPCPEPDSLEERVYTTLLEQPCEDALMSAISWTAGNLVPMMASYGERDSARVIGANTRMYELLKHQPADAGLHAWEGLDHFDTHLMLADPGHAWYGHLEALVARTSR
ncbi:MAG: alpha/beta hydrolase [Pigmentiphaga sp.]|uniref:alpha/beta hydrolase n=1 Tax=Pigmentiphaga sp. TaxID=1977564 RepID=UPI003B56DE87